MLTEERYASALRDLLGDVSAAAQPLLTNHDRDSFTGGSEPNVRVAEVMFFNAVTLSDLWVKSAAFPAALPCAIGRDQSQCAAKFIDAFGRKAMRRPLDNEDRLLWLALFERAAGRGNFVTGIQAVLASMLLHPDFLLHLERGTPTSVAEERRLTPHELANRVSFILRGGPPDEALARAADQGALGTTTEIDRHVQRLLTEPLAQESVLKFYRSWLQLDRTISQAKDQQMFPFWTPSFAREVLEESLAFAAWNFFEADGNIAKLLTDTRAKLTPTLAQLYGLPWREGWVDLPPSERAGILTRAAFIATTAGTRHASASFRGTVLVNDLLCFNLPFPPVQLQDRLALPGDAPGGLTRRQQLEFVTSDLACSACHRMIDPPAFAFGHYDAAGGFRTSDGGLTIDTTGNIDVELDDDQAIRGSWPDAVGLSAFLATQPHVKTCMSRKLWQHLVARPIDEVQDACMLDRLQKAAHSLDGNLRPLLTQTLSDPLFAKFASPPFPQPRASSSESFTLPDAPGVHERAALQAAWQFHRAARAFPPSMRSVLDQWSNVFDELARRFATQTVGAP